MRRDWLTRNSQDSKKERSQGDRGGWKELAAAWEPSRPKPVQVIGIRSSASKPSDCITQPIAEAAGSHQNTRSELGMQSKTGTGETESTVKQQDTSEEGTWEAADEFSATLSHSHSMHLLLGNQISDQSGVSPARPEPSSAQSLLVTGQACRTSVVGFHPELHNQDNESEGGREGPPFTYRLKAHFSNDVESSDVECTELLQLLEKKDKSLANAAMSGALFMLRSISESHFRRVVIRIATSYIFEGMVLASILVSSILMSLDTPRVTANSMLGIFLWRADVAFTVIFCAELVIKVMALGLVLHPGSYLRSTWNLLDCLIVITSIVSLSSSSNALSIIKIVRLVRTLRPLRMISRLRSMQLVVNTLVASVPSVINIAFFGMFEFGLFAILGLQLFAGQFQRCNDAAILQPDGTNVPVVHRSDCVPGPFVCELGDTCKVGDTVERQWTTPMLNFDSFGNAMMTLFTISTLEDYMEIAYMCIDAAGVDMQPIRNYKPVAGLLVIAFVFLGGFFWVSLVVSVIIDQYTRMLEESRRTGEAILASVNQSEWMQVSRLPISQHIELLTHHALHVRYLGYDKLLLSGMVAVTW
jgi:hypothetical protein